MEIRNNKVRVGILAALLAIAVGISYYVLTLRDMANQTKEEALETLESRHSAALYFKNFFDEDEETEIPERRDVSVTDSTEPPVYFIRAVQVGGLYSELVSARAYDPASLFLDENEYVAGSFNHGLDILWVGCKGGYRATRAESSTGNDFIADEAVGYGMEIKDQFKNEILITCEKQ